MLTARTVRRRGLLLIASGFTEEGAVLQAPPRGADYSAAVESERAHRAGPLLQREPVALLPLVEPAVALVYRHAHAALLQGERERETADTAANHRDIVDAGDGVAIGGAGRDKVDN